MPVQSFATLATHPDPPVDELALALAGEFRAIDDAEVRAQLDELGEEVAFERSFRRASPAAGVDALRAVLGLRHGFCGDRRRYDHPNNSMLDVVLERRRGLPIALSVVYLAVARRAGIPLRGVGLPGHFVVGEFGAGAPVLLDPFEGGVPMPIESPRDVRPWGAHETALRMLNNLVASFDRRADLMRTIKAAELRMQLPLDRRLAEALGIELGALRARLN
jgi:regulator of sirC expression with transglutaminase-like and TPR domain